jgi:3-dehydroquinate dehydratase II
MILLVNGPNLNLLGEREPEIYGHETLADVERMVSEVCAGHGLEVLAFQSNCEGALLDFLQEHRHQAQGVILNPGALAETSRALAECVRSLRSPTIEVHISNVHARETWRRQSLVAASAQGQIVGLGIAGYYYAAVHLCSQVAAQAAAGADEAPASGRSEDAPASGYREATPPAAPAEIAAASGCREAAAAGCREAAPAAVHHQAVPASGPGGAPASAHRASARTAPVTGDPGVFGIGDLLPEPSQQVPVEQMPRGDYEPF